MSVGAETGSPAFLVKAACDARHKCRLVGSFQPSWYLLVFGIGICRSARLKRVPTMVPRCPEWCRPICPVPNMPPDYS